MHAYGSVFTQHRQVLAQIELIAELDHCRMPLADLVNRRGREQPFCECVFSHARARGREKLEQAALAEQIEVGGIHVMRVIEAFASFSEGFPAIFDAGESVLVKSDRTLRQVASPKNSGMIRGDRDEYCCGDCEPIRREVVTLE